MPEYKLDKASGLHYLEFGGDTSRQAPTLLILHGNGADAQLYLPVLAALSPHYRILAPDLPGHGYSLECKPTSISGYMAHIHAFIQTQIHGEFAVLAHSLGALVSYLILQKLKPTTLIWMEPAIFKLRPLVKASLPLLSKTYALDKHRREPLVKYMHGLAWEPKQADPVRVASFVEAYMRSCRQVQSLWIKNYPQFLPWDFSHCDVPIVCMRGQKNTFISKATSELVAWLPDAREVIIPRAGHCLLNENNRDIVSEVLKALEPYLIKTGAVQASS